MVLRPESVEARLLKLEEVISRLEELGAVPADRLESDFRVAWAAERGLQLGAETILDIGNHILTAHFGIAATAHEEILLLLERQAVVDARLAQRLRGLGSFRNILVHDYLRLDPELVADALARAPDDYSAYAAAVRDWLRQLDLPRSG